MIDPVYEYDPDAEENGADKSKAVSKVEPESWLHYLFVGLFFAPLAQGLAQGLGVFLFNKMTIRY